MKNSIPAKSLLMAVSLLLPAGCMVERPVAVEPQVAPADGTYVGQPTQPPPANRKEVVPPPPGSAPLWYFIPGQWDWRGPMGWADRPLADASASGRYLAAGQMGPARQRLCAAKGPLAFRRSRRRRIVRPVISEKNRRKSSGARPGRNAAGGTPGMPTQQNKPRPSGQWKCIEALH